MNHTHRLASLLLLVAACSSPAVCGGCAGDDGGLPGGELPDSFRVDAEVTSVELGPGVPEFRVDECTPSNADVDPAGPDWRLEFSRIHDPEEPTFREWSTSHGGDSAANCQREGDGSGDCCQPLVTIEGGWTLSCLGQSIDVSGRNRFDFTFGVDGSGSSTTTRTSNGFVICTVHAEWPALITL